MSVYKVPQDVEAEDKFLGPLTFKQFLFGGGSLVFGYLLFLGFTQSNYLLSGISIVPFLGFTVLAIPWSRDQPTDLWLATRIRFFFVPRKRIWDQSGIKDLVHITVPKREVHVYTDGLSQDQVRNRLNALASVVDTRGWAVKNAQQQRVVQQPKNTASDRLVMQAPVIDEASVLVGSTQDVLEDSGVISQQFDNLIVKSEEKHRNETMQIIQQAREAARNKEEQLYKPMTAPLNHTPSHTEWTAQQQTQEFPQTSTFSAQSMPISPPLPMPSSPPIAQTSTLGEEDEQQLLNHIHQMHEQEHDIQSHSHMKVLQPLPQVGAAASIPRVDPAGQTSMPAIPDSSDEDQATQNASASSVNPAILGLAHDNNLSVETLSREANKDSLSDDEVVISLH
jgi:hypothetical protein